MILSEIEEKIEHYDEVRKERETNFEDKEKLAKQFIKKFPLERIKELELDEYVLGTEKSGDSFCYLLETGLIALGNMKGATSTKFGLYYGKYGADRTLTKKFGNSKEEALENIKSEITKLLIAGKIRDKKVIEKSKLAPLFRYKLLGAYYYDKYLNLYSEKHLSYFITQLGLNGSGRQSILDQEDLLLDFKEKNDITRNWTCLEFNDFLYAKLGHPPNDETRAEKGILPDINLVKSYTVDLEILQSNPKERNEGAIRNNKKLDYIKRNLRNTLLGLRGEHIVLEHEKSLIKDNNEAVIHVAETDDTLGYDIKTVGQDGNEKYIEVKSTKSQPGEFAVYISANELEKAKQLPNYYIYVVFEAHTISPKIWKVKDPINKYEDKMNITPIQYRMDINVKN